MRGSRIKQTEKLRHEVVRYLGYGDMSNVPSEASVFIQKGLDEICAIAEPRITHRYFSLDSESMSISGTDFVFPGNGVRTLLSQCDGIILMAATLGVSADRSIDRAQIQNMAYAFVLDSCATAAIETVCDHWQDDFAATYLHENRYLTSRYSPGYGDLPLSMQPQFLSLLDAERKIGLTVSESFLLSPSKSVTAIVGISRIKQKTISCDICNMQGTCYFRQKGSYCDK